MNLATTINVAGLLVMRLTSPGNPNAVMVSKDMQDPSHKPKEQAPPITICRNLNTAFLRPLQASPGLLLLQLTILTLSAVTCCVLSILNVTSLIRNVHTSSQKR